MKIIEFISRLEESNQIIQIKSFKSIIVVLEIYVLYSPFFCPCLLFRIKNVIKKLAGPNAVARVRGVDQKACFDAPK